MTGEASYPGLGLTGDELVRLLAALASPQRLRIVATLSHGPRHVSDLARAVRLSRPLVHAHLGRLAAAGLVSSRMSISDEGKAMRFVEVTPFTLCLTPELVATAAQTLTASEHRVQAEEERQ